MVLVDTYECYISAYKQGCLKRLRIKPCRVKTFIFSYILHIFDPKHKFWLLVRAATINVLSKNIKTIRIFLMYFSFFTVEKSLYIAWASFVNGRFIHAQNYIMFFVVKQW